MRFEVIIAIVAFWVVFRIILRAQRKKKENLQRGGNITNNSGNPSQEIITSSIEGSEVDEAGHSKEGRSLEGEVEEKSKRVVDPFLEATSLEEGKKSHYNEESLVEEYNRLHGKGKTLEHHKHDFFDEKKDRQKAVKHKGKGASGARGNSDSSGRRGQGASGDGKVGSGQSTQRNERKVKNAHPIAAVMQTQGGRKQAVILSEIMKRPDWDE
jgi:hypothetical protein